MKQFVNPHVIEVRRDLAKLWRQAALALALILAWTLFLYRETAIAMVTIWSRSETFTHGFVVPPFLPPKAMVYSEGANKENRDSI